MDSFKHCQNLAEINDKTLKVNWKIHMLFNHVSEFCNFHKSGLGKFAEQTGESIHAQFKKTWERYKRDPCHNEQGKYLKNSIINFNMRRL